MGRCWICKPAVFTRGGGEHTGLDAFMKCTRCGYRTECHVECDTVTPRVREMLRAEWRYGKKEPTPSHKEPE